MLNAVIAIPGIASATKSSEANQKGGVPLTSFLSRCFLGRFAALAMTKLNGGTSYE
jgi:hypothetical protein